MNSLNHSFWNVVMYYYILLHNMYSSNFHDLRILSYNSWLLQDIEPCLLHLYTLDLNTYKCPWRRWVTVKTWEHACAEINCPEQLERQDSHTRTLRRRLYKIGRLKLVGVGAGLQFRGWIMDHTTGTEKIRKQTVWNDSCGQICIEWRCGNIEK